MYSLVRIQLVPLNCERRFRIIKEQGIRELKKKMIDKNRCDFTTYLSELLNISIGAAGKKLNGKSQFKQDEIKILVNEFDLTGEETKSIFL